MKRLLAVGCAVLVGSSALAEMRSWTFEKSGKVIKGEVVGFSGQNVTMKLPDGKSYTVPIAYLIEDDRNELAVQRVKLWKPLEISELKGSMSAGRYKKCTVKAADGAREVLVQSIPKNVEVILNTRNQQLARIADLSDAIRNQGRAVARADAVTPTGAGGDAGYVDAVMAQRMRVNLAAADLEQAKDDLENLRAAHVQYVAKTTDETIVRMKNTGLVYQGLEVWECEDPRKPNQ